jgi:hypothetical protein
VITSLREVPDDVTRDRMLDFYRRLRVEGKPKSRALWEEKMRIRDARGEGRKTKPPQGRRGGSVGSQGVDGP